jgi:uncharacterized membrane protein YcfT
MIDNDTPNSGRIDWVDYAKGFCIILVVMMYAVLGAEQTAGQHNWLHCVVVFTKPLRMPAFFLIAGLFLAQVIDRDWRTYLDRKLVHFFYFYLLWTTIQFAVKAPFLVHDNGPMGTVWLYARAFVEPIGALWFIYVLPICFVVAKLAHSWRIPPLVIWLAAAAIEIVPIATGSTVIDEFTGRFVFFYTGYLFAPRIFAFAKHAQASPEIALAGLATWGLINGLFAFNGLAGTPFMSLVLGLTGAAAVVAAAALLAKIDLIRSLRYCGQNAITIYLAFFLPVTATQALLLKAGWVSNIGTISAIVTFAGVAGALTMAWIMRRTFLRFLFERPQLLRLRPAPSLNPRTAEDAYPQTNGADSSCPPAQARNSQRDATPATRD